MDDADEGRPAGSRSRRWTLVLPAAVLGMAGYGIVVYGQSAFIVPVGAQVPSLSASTMPYAFSVRSFTFGAVNVLGGSLLLGGSPRCRVALAVLMLVVSCVAVSSWVSLAGTSMADYPDARPSAGALASLYAPFVLLGLACACYYLPVYHPVLGWFPDRPGLVAGCLGVGQGAGGTLWNFAAPMLAEQLPASTLFLVYGGTVALLWSCAAVFSPPPTAAGTPLRTPAASEERPSGPDLLPPGRRRVRVLLSGPRSRPPGGDPGTFGWCRSPTRSRWRTAAADTALPLALLGWLSVSMAFGFGLFAVLLYFLQGAVGLSPQRAAGVAAGFGIVFLLARLGAGVAYDRLGARRFALTLHCTNLALHACLVAQQLSVAPPPAVPAPAAPPQAAEADGGSTGAPGRGAASWALWPILVLLLCCNAGAVTCWGPLSLDLLGASRGKRWMGVMVSSISLAQASGSAAMGLVVSLRGIGAAMLAFAAGTGIATALSSACLLVLLRQGAGRRRPGQAPASAAQRDSRMQLACVGGGASAGGGDAGEARTTEPSLARAAGAPSPSQTAGSEASNRPRV
jgi:hypothetical protein